MQIYTGLDYSYKWKYCIKECIKNAKENPFTTYYIIVKDPSYIEEAFLQHTDALFNIEILTVTGLLKKLQSCTIETLTNIQKMMLIKKVLENNQDNMLYQPHNIFTIIHDILPIFDAFYYANIQSIENTSLPILSKEKVAACFSLYQQFIKNIPSTHVYSPIDTANTDISNQVFYFMEDCILQPKIMSFVASLDKNNTVHILSNHTVDDTRLLQTTYQKYFDKYINADICTNDNYQTFITSNLFSNNNASYHDTHPFAILKETNPIEEIKSVCFSIHQDIIENKASYHDFAIYYPNTQYLNLLQETMASYGIPITPVSLPKESSIITACLRLLQYTKTKEETDFLCLLDSLLLKKCTHFKQVNYYKKQWQETGQIIKEEYLSLRQHINQTYVKPLLLTTTMQQKSSIMIRFLQDEIVYDDNLPNIISYFSVLEAYQDTIRLDDFITLLINTGPTNNEKEIAKLDHIYVFNYQQTYSGLLPFKTIYLLGLNETIVPTAIKDEGLLLDREKATLGLSPTIVDTLSLQQNHFLKILTSPVSSIILSYAMASTTNETLLPSSYLLHLQELFTIPTVTTDSYYNHPSNAHRLYALGGVDSNYTQINQILSYYTQHNNQPEPLANVPYPNVMSASQLETYNGCPYKYFCQYGLHMQPMSTAILQANEIGTLVHYVLEASTHFFHRRERAIKLDATKLKQHIYESIDTYINSHPEIEIKLQKVTNQFIIQCIKEDMYNTILILIDQMSVSNFQVESTEEKLQTTYCDIEMKGFVDRVDTYGNYLKVTDYKSSDKDLDLSLAMQGFNIQMLLYMDMLANQKQLEKGALLYFNTKKRILKSTLSILEPELPENFLKQYRMNGYVVEDIVEEIDNQIDKASNIIKVRYVKKDDSYKGNVLSKEQLQKLLNEVGKHISNVYHQMFTGDIRVSPKASNNPTIHTKVNPCSYCPYRAICNLDVFYNKPTLVKQMDVDTILGGKQDGEH